MTWVEGDGESWKGNRREPQLFDAIDFERRYQAVVRRHFRIAEGIKELDFTILRMHLLQMSNAEIARRLGKKASFVKESIGDTGRYLYRFVTEGTLEELFRVSSDVCEHGHTTQCTGCGDPVHRDQLHCKWCGEPNIDFNHWTFQLLRGHSMTIERHECHRGHPKAVAAGYKEFCTSCGKDLEPLHRTDS